MAERLVRSFCAECRVAFEPRTPDLPADFPGVAENQPPARLWRGAGCRKCHQTGYRGRTGIYELLVTTDFIKELIVQRTNANQIRLEAFKAGMLTLRHDGWRKVLSGVTTIEEVARVTASDVIA